MHWLCASSILPSLLPIPAWAYHLFLTVWFNPHWTMQICRGWKLLVLLMEAWRTIKLWWRGKTVTLTRAVCDFCVNSTRTKDYAHRLRRRESERRSPWNDASWVLFSAIKNRRGRTAGGITVVLCTKTHAIDRIAAFFHNRGVAFDKGWWWLPAHSQLEPTPPCSLLGNCC